VPSNDSEWPLSGILIREVNGRSGTLHPKSIAAQLAICDGLLTVVAARCNLRLRMYIALAMLGGFAGDDVHFGRQGHAF
jgi:hypothetical protein